MAVDFEWRFGDWKRDEETGRIELHPVILIQVVPSDDKHGVLFRFATVTDPTHMAAVRAGTREPDVLQLSMPAFMALSIAAKFKEVLSDEKPKPAVN